MPSVIPSFGSFFSLKVAFAALIAVTLLYFVFVSEASLKSMNSEKKFHPLHGLKINGKNFTLNKKPFRILSGAMHYFRIPQQLWGDRIVKLKAMGLNTVETYVPWNLHEPEPGKFDFDGPLDVSAFIESVWANGLYVILRPGPYVCTEWDLGGLPSWLLRDKNMKLRSMYKPFITAVDRYLKNLAERIKNLQYSSGGPIIAIQIENEYGSFGKDSKYMEYLKKSFTKHGLTELHFVCDNAQGIGKYNLDGALKTVNFQTEISLLKKLETIQPNAPLFVAEFWIGWFDHWGEKHHKVKSQDIVKIFTQILQMGGSFNLYMFHGGTNFGFMNGANADRNGKDYSADTTSYDYDAPISEVGDVTPKFHTLKQILKAYAPSNSLPTDIPWIQETPARSSYGDVSVNGYMTLDDLLEFVDNRVSSKKVMCMEDLPINNEAGQSYGYILYRTTIKSSAQNIVIRNVRDHTMVMIDGEVIKTSHFGGDVVEVPLTKLKGKEKRKLDILVENCGRVNYERSLDRQRKGILGTVEVDGVEHEGWEIYPLDFKPSFVSRLIESNSWQGSVPSEIKTPALFKTDLYVHSIPHDTLLKYEGWTKGAIFVHEINIGRYWNKGPQKTLFVPGQWLRMKSNVVLIFELHGAPASMKLTSVGEPEYTDTTYFKI